jgi:hypothetical protein
MGDSLSADRPQRRDHLTVAPTRELPDVEAEVHPFRARCPGKADDRDLGAAMDDDEAAAKPGERRAQVRQRLEHEPDAAGAEVRTAEQAIVEAEHRDDGVRLAQRRGQRWMVVHAQVAAKPRDRRGRAGHYPPSTSASADSRAGWRNA